MAQLWPLTGRVEELRFVDGLGRRGGGSAGVVLAGAAGVGKTRLAREAAAAARRRGGTVRWVTASQSARGVPLGAFAPVLGPSGTDPAGLLAAATAALGDAGLLCVDDAHLLDQLSAALVHQLVQRGVATVVLTLRSGEPAPDPVTALWTDGPLSRLELQPLSEAQTAELLDAVLDPPLDPATIARLFRITQGNVLYLRHLVEGETAAGTLGRTDGLWRWTGEPRLSPGLVELVDARMGALPAPLREVVDLLAFGEPIGLPVLARLAGADPVEQAEGRGLIEVRPDGRRRVARLAHPLYGEVQRARCGTLRSRRLRGTLATALAATGARRAGDLLRRAVLTLDSDLPVDPDLLLGAARAALAVADAVLAERLIRGACAGTETFEAHLMLGFTLGWLCRGDEAEAAFTAAATLARTDAERLRLALQRSAILYAVLARVHDAAAVLDRAHAEMRSGQTRSELDGARSCIATLFGRTDRAVELGRRLLADPDASDPAVAWTTWGLAGSLSLMGRVQELDGVLARGYPAIARSVETAVLRVNVSFMELWAFCLAGMFDRASATVLPRSSATIGVFATMHLAMLEGRLALDRGQAATAARVLRGVLPAFPGSGGGWTSILSGPAAQACALSGDLAAARETLEHARRNPHPGVRIADPDLLLAQAWVAAAEGTVTTAIELARRAAGLAASQQQWAVEVLARQTAVQFGDRTQAGRLADLAGIVDGPRAPAAAAHARALADADAAGLTAASRRWEEIGALLVAADAAAQAWAVHDGAGRRGSATTAAARAADLARRCEDARTPALDAMRTPLPLTAREREIAALAAAGLTNREIAERLAISVRTVEGHLYRTCTKLGVSDRAALAALLG